MTITTYTSGGSGGGFSLPDTTGNTSKLLTNDGNGNASWVGGMNLIATSSSSSAQSITFDSIPQTYKHLKLITSYYNSANISSATLTTNATTNSYYMRTMTDSTGSPYTYSVDSNNVSSWVISCGTTQHASHELTFYNYASSVNFKSLTSVGIYGNNTRVQHAGMTFQDKLPITKLVWNYGITPTAPAEFTFSLYGVY